MRVYRERGRVRRGVRRMGEKHRGEREMHDSREKEMRTVKRKERKKERKERKERKKERGKMGRGDGRLAGQTWLAVAGDQRWPAAVAPNPSQWGCKSRANRNFGVLEMMLRRAIDWFVRKSIPRRRIWLGY